MIDSALNDCISYNQYLKYILNFFYNYLSLSVSMNQITRLRRGNNYENIEGDIQHNINSVANAEFQSIPTSGSPSSVGSVTEGISFLLILKHIYIYFFYQLILC